MFDYDPMSKDVAEKLRYSLLEDGQYPGVITACVAKASNAGKWMFDMTVDVYDKAGLSHSIRTFLVFQPNMMWKVISCCESTGLIDAYNDKKLDDHLFVGKNCHVDIKTDKGKPIPVDKLQGKPVGSQYPDKNVISNFISKPTSATIAPVAQEAFSDDIPF